MCRKSLSNFKKLMEVHFQTHRFLVKNSVEYCNGYIVLYNILPKTCIVEYYNLWHILPLSCPSMLPCSYISMVSICFGFFVSIFPSSHILLFSHLHVCSHIPQVFYIFHISFFTANQKAFFVSLCYIQANMYNRSIVSRDKFNGN